MDPVEIETCEQTAEFIRALDAFNIAHTDSLYDGGDHAWNHWMRELGNFLAWLPEQLAMTRAAPASFDYRSARARFTAWGWQFAAYRDAREFMYLKGVSASGLEVRGSGILDVITAPAYAPGKDYRLDVNGAISTLKSDATGRLAFRLDLGASHVPQQMEFERVNDQSPASGNPDPTAGWTHLRVRIAAI